MEELPLPQLIRRITANKGYLTKEIQKATREMERFADNNCKRLSIVLREVELKIRHRMDVLSGLYEAAAQLEPLLQGQEELITKSAEVVTQGESALDLIDGTLRAWEDLQEEVEEDDGVSLGGGVTPPGRVSPPLPPVPKPPMLREIVGLRPPKLLMEARPVEVNEWLSQFKAYHRGSHMEVADLYVQQSFFKNAIDIDLRTLLEGKITEDSTIEMCMDAINDIFIEKHPLIARRFDFFTSHQPKGMKWTLWHAKMTQLRVQCNQQAMDAEDAWLNFLKTNMDPEGDLQEKFLRLDTNTEAKMVEVARAYEEAASCQVVFGGDAGRNRANKALAQGSDAGDKVVKRVPFDGTCHACLRKGHTSKFCIELKRGRLTCSKCKKKGHIVDSPYCKQKPGWSGGAKQRVTFPPDKTNKSNMTSQVKEVVPPPPYSSSTEDEEEQQERGRAARYFARRLKAKEPDVRTTQTRGPHRSQSRLLETRHKERFTCTNRRGNNDTPLLDCDIQQKQQRDLYGFKEVKKLSISCLPDSGTTKSILLQNRTEMSGWSRTTQSSTEMLSGRRGVSRLLLR